MKNFIKQFSIHAFCVISILSFQEVIESQVLATALAGISLFGIQLGVKALTTKSATYYSFPRK